MISDTPIVQALQEKEPPASTAGAAQIHLVVPGTSDLIQITSLREDVHGIAISDTRTVASENIGLCDIPDLLQGYPTDVQNSPKNRQDGPKILQRYPLEDHLSSFISSLSTKGASRPFLSKSAHDLSAHDTAGINDSGSPVSPLADLPHGLPGDVETGPGLPGESDRTCQTGAQKLHSFSRALGREFGIPEACLLQFLAHKLRASQNFKDNQPYYYDSADAIATRLPYYTGKGMNEILNRLIANGLIQAAPVNWLPGDRRRRFTMNIDFKRRVLSATDRVYFSEDDAVVYGIRGALMLYHFEQRSWPGNDKWPSLNLSWLARHLGFAKSTLHRTLNDLIEIGLISKCPARSGRTEYRIIHNGSRRPIQPLAQRSSDGTKAEPNPSNSIQVAPAPPKVPAPTPSNHACMDLIRLNNENHSAPSEEDCEGLFQLATRFVGSLSDRELLKFWAARATPDKLLEYILVATQSIEDRSTLLFEFLLITFLGNRLSGHNCLILSRGYKLHLHVMERHQTVRRDQNRVDYEQAKRSSPSYGLEQDRSLNPARKCAVLRDGIAARNRSPLLDECDRPIIFKAIPTDYRNSQIFFEEHPYFSAGDLLSVMECAATLPVSGEEAMGGFDSRWHARKAGEVEFLLKHFDKILKQLGNSELLDRMTENSDTPSVRKRDLQPIGRMAHATRDPWQDQEDGTGDWGEGGDTFSPHVPAPDAACPPTPRGKPVPCNNSPSHE